MEGEEALNRLELNIVGWLALEEVFPNISNLVSKPKVFDNEQTIFGRHMKIDVSPGIETERVFISLLHFPSLYAKSAMLPAKERVTMTSLKDLDLWVYKNLWVGEDGLRKVVITGLGGDACT